MCVCVFYYVVFRQAIIIICTLGRRKKDSRTVTDARLEAESTKYREILPTMKCRVSNLPDSDGEPRVSCGLLTAAKSLFTIFKLYKYFSTSATPLL